MADARYGRKSWSGWRCTGGANGPGMFWQALLVNVTANTAAHPIASLRFIPDTIHQCFADQPFPVCFRLNSSSC
jgi:hypothetical protein